MRKAYSLVELSIVLVIISFIVVAILTGDGLRTQYKIQSIISEYSYYTRAIRLFESQYKYLPGDFPSAGTLWSTPASNNCIDGIYPNGCNGDGNGIINSFNYGGEALRVWQHLSLSGLIVGNYNGIGSGYSPMIPNSIPALKVSGISLSFQNYTNLGVTVNSVVIGGLSCGAGATKCGSPAQTGGIYAISDQVNDVIKVTEMQAIDTKIDDGVSYSGTIMGAGWFSTGNSACSYLPTGTAADYQLINNKAYCFLISPWNE